MLDVLSGPFRREPINIIRLDSKSDNVRSGNIRPRPDALRSILSSHSRTNDRLDTEEAKAAAENLERVGGPSVESGKEAVCSIIYLLLFFSDSCT